MQKQKARRRMSKREMKEDKLLIWTSRTFEYIEDHLWPLVLAAVSVLLVILVGYLYGAWQQQQIAKGTVELSAVQRAAATGNTDAVISEADDVIDDYMGIIDTKARLLKAEALLQNGEFARAEPLFDDVLGDMDDEVHTFRAAMGLADCLAARGEYGDAGRTLARWASSHDDTGLAPYALVQAATNFELGHEFIKARDALQAVLDDYEDSQITGQARSRLRMIEGAVAAVQ